MTNSQAPKNIERPIWISVTEAAKIMGVDGKTIRRAIKQEIPDLKYRIDNDRYQIEIGSLINFAVGKIKLRHKFERLGLGQYLGPLPQAEERYKIKNETKKTAPDS